MGSTSAWGWSVKEAFLEEVAPEEVGDEQGMGWGGGTLRQGDPCMWSPGKGLGSVRSLRLCKAERVRLRKLALACSPRTWEVRETADPGWQVRGLSTTSGHCRLGQTSLINPSEHRGGMSPGPASREPQLANPVGAGGGACVPRCCGPWG